MPRESDVHQRGMHLASNVYPKAMRLETTVKSTAMHRKAIVGPKGMCWPSNVNQRRCTWNPMRIPSHCTVYLRSVPGKCILNEMWIHRKRVGGPMRILGPIHRTPDANRNAMYRNANVNPRETQRRRFGNHMTKQRRALGSKRGASGNGRETRW